MTTPATSRTSPKALSANTVAGYAADWALFTDWCAATNRVALPVDWAAVAAFIAACPGAPATVADGSRPSRITTAPLISPHP